jgi:Late endosomal/lysosomal adaptor and MAPK and MTOR activator
MGACASCLGLSGRGSHGVSTFYAYPHPLLSMLPAVHPNGFSKGFRFAKRSSTLTEPQQSESSRLLDDDPYQSGYGYGTVNQGHRYGPSPEDLKREREALEAICQRTSE